MDLGDKPDFIALTNLICRLTLHYGGILEPPRSQKSVVPGMVNM